MWEDIRTVQDAFNAFDDHNARYAEWVNERSQAERAAARKAWQSFRNVSFQTMRQEFVNGVVARNGRFVDMESSENSIGLTLYTLSGLVVPTGITLSFYFHPKHLTITPYMYYKGDSNQGMPTEPDGDTRALATLWFGHFLKKFFDHAR
jgi:hypothetical protein